jgi:hypothetical protein
MHSHFRAVLGSVSGVAILMIFILGFHLGGQGLLHVGTFSPLLGAFIGGTLVLVSVNIQFRREENAEPWFGRERLAWTLIGCGCIGWGIGECFWRYYVAQGQNPFPSLADLGYSSFPPLVFAGLILQPISKSRAHRRTFLLLDSLIAMGALLSIAWFLLLGSLAQTPAESVLGKFLGLYYATSDVALLSCIIFLLLRGSDPVYLASARRVSLMVVGLGISIFAGSDFLFNVLQNLGLPVDGTWVDLGWPLGMMTMGVAAYLRRFQPRNTLGSVIQDQETRRTQQFSFGPSLAVPYLLLVLLFLVLAINVLSSDTTQQGIRPVLIVATLIVVGLVIARQIVTILENVRLMHEQVMANYKLEQVYQDIAKRKADLEAGVTYLKGIQTRLANGDMRARANIIKGDLWPLASGLNIMADRMMRSEQRQKYVQQIITVISDLSQALERSENNRPFVLPASCLYAPPELHRLLLAIGLKPLPWTPPSSEASARQRRR